MSELNRIKQAGAYSARSGTRAHVCCSNTRTGSSMAGAVLLASALWIKRMVSARTSMKCLPIGPEPRGPE